jgi:hypothetical protein
LAVLNDRLMVESFQEWGSLQPARTSERYAALEIVDAVYRSCRTGQKITFAEYEHLVGQASAWLQPARDFISPALRGDVCRLPP